MLKTLAVALVLFGSGRVANGGPPVVDVARVPDGGIQPQAVVDADGTVCLLYFKGEAKAGDLFYVRSGEGAAELQWSKPIRVNSEAGSAVAVGNDRGGQIALGRAGFVHVAWNGSATAREPGKSSPMLFSRLVPGHERFEAQRNVMVASTQLDGGGSVAADRKGNVFVVWHGSPIDAEGTSEKGEASRRVFIASSADDGATFSPEAGRSDAANGACGCCGLKTAVNCATIPNGDLLVLYRAAGRGVHRDMHLLRSTDEARTFTDTMIDPWEFGACPMTTAAFAPGAKGTVMAWETQGDVRWAIESEKGVPGEIRKVGPKGEGRKYPAVAMDEGGRVLVAWTEGMHWAGGGNLKWQVFDEDGKAVEGGGGNREGVPAWSLVAAVAKKGGGFLILY